MKQSMKNIITPIKTMIQNVKSMKNYQLQRLVPAPSPHSNHTVCKVLPRMLLSAITIMVLRLVNIVDNCDDNK